MNNKILSFLYRKTSSWTFIAEVDGFRFFAIATVVLYHLNTHFSRVIQPFTSGTYFTASFTYKAADEGAVGVNVFFAISGFILALPFAKQHLFKTSRVDVKGYFIRRLTRLEPPYVISLILFLGVHIMILHENLRDIFPNFLASLFYLHSFIFNQWSKINPVTWSLEVEVQFYVLAPLLAMIFCIPKTPARRASIIAVIILSVLHYNFNYDWINHWHLRKSLFMHLHQFFVGFLMADIYLVSWKSQKQTKSYLWDFFGLAGITSVLIWNNPFNVIHDFLFTVSLLVAFTSIFKGHLLNRFYSSSAVVIIGGMCYTIYLLHYAAIAFMAERTIFLFNPEWTYTVNFWVQALVIVPTLLVISSAYFVLVERPCMDKDWPRKLKAKVISIFA